MLSQIKRQMGQSYLDREDKLLVSDYALDWQYIHDLKNQDIVALQFSLKSKLNANKSISLRSIYRDACIKGELHALIKQFILEAANVYWIAKSNYVRINRFSIPIPLSELRHLEFCKDIATLKVSLGLPNHALCIALSEKDPAIDMTSIRKNLLFLTESGVDIALNDYLSGITGLHYFLNLPIQSISMSACQTKKVVQQQMECLIEMAIQNCNQLGLDFIADGVTSEDEVDRLTALGCRFGNGAFFDFHKGRH